MTQLSHHIELNLQTATVSASLPDSASASLPNSASATHQNATTAPNSASLPNSPSATHQNKPTTNSASRPNSPVPTVQTAPATSTPSLDDLFESIPEGTRIIISGNRVTFENMTPELAQIAEALAGKTS